MHPVLFQTNNFTLNTLWIFVAAAVIVGTYTLIHLAVKNGLKIQFLSDNSWKIILWSLLGARLFAIILNYKVYFYEFSPDVIFGLFKIWDKGLSLWGAVIGFLIFFYFLCQKEEKDFFKWLDAIVPAVILGLAISHIGAFFEGSNYGHETSLPWGVNFESPTIKYAVPIHPTQIYAAIYSAILFTGLIFLSKHKKVITLEKSGFLALVGICTYNLLRFLEEFIRGDDVYTILGIRISQIFAFLITISSGIFLYLRYNERQKKVTKSKNV